MSTEYLTLPIGGLCVTGGTQARVALNQDVVAQYKAALEDGDKLPPVVVFNDGCSDGVWLAEGFHRYHAHLAAGLDVIDCEVHIGTQRDAILYAVGANAKHGLPRTNEDKRHAVGLLLKDAEWASWADNAVAKACHVSNHLVAEVRGALTLNSPSEKPASRTYVNKHGTVTTMATAKIGKNQGTRATPRDTTPPVAPVLSVVSPGTTVTDAEPAEPDELAQLRAENAQLREEMAELQAAMASTIADNEAMGRVFDANDKLKAAMDEVTRMRAVAENAERSFAARCDEFNERIRLVEYWRNRAERAEKALKKAAA